MREQLDFQHTVHVSIAISHSYIYMSFFSNEITGSMIMIWFFFIANGTLKKNQQITNGRMAVIKLVNFD